MGKGRILVLEDDMDISKMLRIYFDSQGYEVLCTPSGEGALDICRRKLPNVAILDIQVAGYYNGYDVCSILRSNPRSSYLPIIFLTQKDERSDKIYGLQLGADDYITKPFDIEELKLRVEGAIRRSLREARMHMVTNLPAGKLIEEELAKLLFDENWTLLYLGIRNVNAFKEVYGPIQVNEVLIYLADIMRESVEAYGTLNDFIGQASDNDFIIISTSKTAPHICKAITERFNEECKVFYSFKDKEQGYITYKDIDGVTQKADFMKLAVGVVSSKEGPFADIVQITEDGAENRRHNPSCPEAE